MLVKEIIKYTKRSHEDFEDLQSALVRIKEVNDTINQRKREDEARRKFIEIQNSILWPSKKPLHLIKEGRYFIREGDLMELKSSKKTGTFHFFLFNDIMIRGKGSTVKKNGVKSMMYEHRGTIPISETQLFQTAATPEMPFPFQLSYQFKGKDQLITLNCSSDQELQGWVADIKKGIHISRNLVAERQSSESRTGGRKFISISSKTN